MSWIRIEDEMPPAGTGESFAVVVEHKNADVHAPWVRDSYLSSDGLWSVGFLREPTVWRVTHWQRLPSNGTPAP